MVQEEVRRFVLEREGEVLSLLRVSASRPGSPEYESNRHQVEMRLEVLADHRRRGIATSWLPLVATFAKERGARLVSAPSCEESGFAFLRWVGAEPRLREWESRLELDKVDWDLMRSWAELPADGLRLESYAPFPPREVWEAYAAGYTELSNHVPREEMEIGEWILTPEQMADDEARQREQGLTRHVLAAWDAEGLVGVTEMLKAAHDDAGLNQELTAVHPRARGRGLGKLLKARLLLEVRNLYAQVRYVRTGNAASNAPMLSINVRMGFRRHRLWIEHQVEVSRLESLR